MAYTAHNIDGLLLARHTAGKIRSGGRQGLKKRTRSQAAAFTSALGKLLQEEGIV